MKREKGRAGSSRNEMEAQTKRSAFMQGQAARALLGTPHRPIWDGMPLSFIMGVWGSETHWGIVFYYNDCLEATGSMQSAKEPSLNAEATV